MADDHEEELPEVAHDDRDVDARRIVRFSIGVLALTGVAMGVMWVLGIWLVDRREAKDVPPPPMATERPVAPPDPKLQPVPMRGLEQLRAEEDAQLTGYGWVDRDEGLVQIPIDRAVELLARRGLPARRQGPPIESPHSEPNESGLGLKEERR